MGISLESTWFLLILDILTSNDIFRFLFNCLLGFGFFSCKIFDFLKYLKVQSILFFVPVLCPLYCYHQSHPVNYLLLGAFTVSLSFAVGLTCAFTSGKILFFLICFSTKKTPTWCLWVQMSQGRNGDLVPWSDLTEIQSW